MIEIPRSLAKMQELVGGGYVEAVALERDRDGGGLDLMCNDEGRILGLDLSVLHPTAGPIAGNCFVSRYDDEGETVSVTDADVAAWAGLPRLTGKADPAEAGFVFEGVPL